VAAPGAMAAAGIGITDTDGNAIPDSAEQIRAIYDQR